MGASLANLGFFVQKIVFSALQTVHSLYICDETINVGFSEQVYFITSVPHA